MTEYLKIKPKLLPIKNILSIVSKNKEIWLNATSLGAKRAGVSRDLINDKDGNAYLTGFFDDNKKGGDGWSYPFIASYGENNELKWIHKFKSKGRSYGFALEKQGDELYLAGSFRGSLEIGGLKLESYQSLPDLFFALFSGDGELVWLKKPGIDSLEIDANLTYFAKFDRTGNNMHLQLMNEDDRNIVPGFYGDDQNWLYFIGSRNWTTGMARISVGKPGVIVKSSKFSQERSNFIANNCEVTIAGFAALMKLLSNLGTETNGVQMQSIIASINPSLSTSNPALFSAIGQIEKLQNQDGLITITTVGKEVISIYRLKIENNARFKMAETSNNDLMIRVISGIDYTDVHYKSKLNAVLVDISSGNLIFDYDHDHTLLKTNYKREVLKLR
jgi:hypothetical protein